MDDDRASKRINGCGAKVELAVVVIRGGHGRGKFGLVEEVEREIGLGNKPVPHEVWECAVKICKNREKVGFEILYCTFRSVALRQCMSGGTIWKVDSHFYSIWIYMLRCIHYRGFGGRRRGNSS